MDRCTCCGATVPSDELDITEDGTSCARCTQARAIVAHQQAWEAKVAAHNEYKAAHGRALLCPECEGSLPRSPILVAMSLPPETVRCRHCGTRTKMPFRARTRWLRSVVWTVTLPVALLIAGVSLLFADEPTRSEVFGSLVAAAILASAFASATSFVLAYVLGWHRRPSGPGSTRGRS